MAHRTPGAAEFLSTDLLAARRAKRTPSEFLSSPIFLNQARTGPAHSVFRKAHLNMFLALAMRQTSKTCTATAPKRQKAPAIRGHLNENICTPAQFGFQSAQFGASTGRALGNNPHSNEIRPRFPPCQIYSHWMVRSQQPQTSDEVVVLNRGTKVHFARLATSAQSR